MQLPSRLKSVAHHLHFLTTLLGVVLCFIPYANHGIRSTTLQKAALSEEVSEIRLVLFVSIPISAKFLLDSLRLRSISCRDSTHRRLMLRLWMLQFWTVMISVMPLVLLSSHIDREYFFVSIDTSVQFIVLGATLISFPDSPAIDSAKAALLISITYIAAIFAEICRLSGTYEQVWVPYVVLVVIALLSFVLYAGIYIKDIVTTCIQRRAVILLSHDVVCLTYIVASVGYFAAVLGLRIAGGLYHFLYPLVAFITVVTTLQLMHPTIDHANVEEENDSNRDLPMSPHQTTASVATGKLAPSSVKKVAQGRQGEEHEDASLHIHITGGNLMSAADVPERTVATLRGYTTVPQSDSSAFSEFSNQGPTGSARGGGALLDGPNIDSTGSSDGKSSEDSDVGRQIAPFPLKLPIDSKPSGGVWDKRSMDFASIEPDIEAGEFSNSYDEEMGESVSSASKGNSVYVYAPGSRPLEATPPIQSTALMHHQALVNARAAQTLSDADENDKDGCDRDSIEGSWNPQGEMENGSLSSSISHSTIYPLQAVFHEQARPQLQLSPIRRMSENQAQTTHGGDTTRGYTNSRGSGYSVDEDTRSGGSRHTMSEDRADDRTDDRTYDDASSTSGRIVRVGAASTGGGSASEKNDQWWGYNMWAQVVGVTSFSNEVDSVQGAAPAGDAGGAFHPTAVSEASLAHQLEAQQVAARIRERKRLEAAYIRALTFTARMQFRSIGFPGRPDIEEFMLLTPELGSHVLPTRFMMDQLRVDIANLSDSYELVLRSIDDVAEPETLRQLVECMQLVSNLTLQIGTLTAYFKNWILYQIDQTAIRCSGFFELLISRFKDTSATLIETGTAHGAV